MNNLWVEKYRPKTMEDYVFCNDTQKDQVSAWIAAGSIPHLLFSGTQGAGKTTLAYILFNALGTHDGDILKINASSANSVDYIRDIVTGFVSTMPFGEFKYVLLDEADYLSHSAQACLRGVMETYSAGSRFILTCNYPHKIIPAIHSRCQGFQIDSLDRNEYTLRVATILAEEGIEMTLEVLDMYVAATYPDMRKCINLCQMNSQSGKLEMPKAGGDNLGDYKLEMVAMFKEKMFAQARKLICTQIAQEEYEEVYRFLYQNLDMWGDTKEQEQAAILAIRDGLCKHAICADSEINLSATLVVLEQIATI